VAAVAPTVPAMFDRAGCASHVRIDFPDWWGRGEPRSGDECVSYDMRPPERGAPAGRARARVDVCGEPAREQIAAASHVVDFGDRVLRCARFRRDKPGGLSCTLDFRRGGGTPQLQVRADNLSLPLADDLLLRLLTARLVDWNCPREGGASCLACRVRESERERFEQEMAVGGPVFSVEGRVDAAAPGGSGDRVTSADPHRFHPPFEPWCAYELAAPTSGGMRVRRTAGSAGCDDYEVSNAGRRVATGRACPDAAAPAPQGGRTFVWQGARYTLKVATSERDGRWTVAASAGDIATLLVPRSVDFSSVPLGAHEASALVHALANLVLVPRACDTRDTKGCARCEEINRTRAAVLKSGAVLR
jgi:hypothetical protein